MKRKFFSKIKMKKVLFLILLAALIQMVLYSLRDFMISISLSLAVRGNRNLSLGMLLHFKIEIKSVLENTALLYQ